MKAIHKAAEPKQFSTWKPNNAQKVTWNAFSDSTVSHRPVYDDLKEVLIAQQENLCCYCEVALKGDRDSHVEHVKPQSKSPNDKYDFQNLLASCNSPKSCGHKKGKGSLDGLISPLDPNCEQKFTYTGTGKMVPANEADQAAQGTIELLGLNCKYLQDRRKSIIKALGETDSKYLNKALGNCIEWHKGFYTVIDYLIKK